MFRVVRWSMAVVLAAGCSGGGGGDGGRLEAGPLPADVGPADAAPDGGPVQDASPDAAVLAYTGALGEWFLVDGDVCRAEIPPTPGPRGLDVAALVPVGDWLYAVIKPSAEGGPMSDLYVCSAPIAADGPIGPWTVAATVPPWPADSAWTGVRVAAEAGHLYLAPTWLYRQDDARRTSAPVLLLELGDGGTVTSVGPSGVEVDGEGDCPLGVPATGVQLFGQGSADTMAPLPGRPGVFLASSGCGASLGALDFGAGGAWTPFFSAPDALPGDPAFSQWIDERNWTTRGAVSRCGDWLVSTGVQFDTRDTPQPDRCRYHCATTYGDVFVARASPGSPGWVRATQDLEFSRTLHTSLCVDDLLFLFGGWSLRDRTDMTSGVAADFLMHDVSVARVDPATGFPSRWRIATAATLPRDDWLARFPFHHGDLIYALVNGALFAIPMEKAPASP
jgi:hypothetical protein